MAKGSGAEPGLTGILCVDKPAGWTSHDVVAKVRRLSGQRQIGHTGTLDPMATGVLVLCVGRATRLAEYMTGHDKAYEGTIQLGAATTTDDAEGEVTERAAVPSLTADALASVASRFTGDIEQVPPAFSAIKVGGQRSYAIARKGGDVALSARRVTISSLVLEKEAEDSLRIRVECGAGTYVRSLARDIGLALGTRAHLASLRRTRVGAFTLSDAVTLESLIEAGVPDFEALLLPPDEGVTDLVAAIVRDERGTQLAHGGRIRVAAEHAADPARIYTASGEFVGIGAIDGSSVLRPAKVLTL